MSLVPAGSLLVEGAVSDLRAIPSAAAPEYPNWVLSVNGGQYVWSASSALTDNGRSIIKPTDGGAAGRWLLVTPPYAYLNALDFGVLGDGTTDDAAALNAFIAAVASAGAAGYIPGNRSYNLVLEGLFATGGGSVASKIVCGPGAKFLCNYPLAGSIGLDINLGNCVWEGGEFNQSIVDGTSATSVNLTGLSGPVTMTTQTGITNITASVGSFIRIYSRANPANAFDGIVTSYNSGTGSLVMNTVFPQGSGTHTDWNINIVRTAVKVDTVSGVQLKGVSVTGTWYLGIQLYAFNTSGNSNITQNCTVRDCTVTDAQNRAFYVNGNISYCTLENCRAITSGVTNYGFNINPGNSGSQSNQVNSVKLNDCYSLGCVFQGFSWSEFTFYTVATNCTVTGTPTTSGFLFQEANTGGQPSYCGAVGCRAASCATGFNITGSLYITLTNCDAIGCTVGHFIGPTAGVQSQFCSISGGAEGCNTGIEVAGNSNRCDLSPVRVIGSTGVGVKIDSGAVGTLVTGRSFTNTGGNLTDAGTSSVTTGLVVT